MIRLAILWHMHQPQYQDPQSGDFRLPWTRLHALKDYYGMARLASEFPSLRLTFNLVPSLVRQLQDYAAGRGHDPFLAAARTPVEDLGAEGREFLLRYFFQAHPDHVIGRYPRYAELLAKFRQDNWDPAHGARHFTDAELLDLQVLSQLAWVDEYWLEQEPARELAARGRDFRPQDRETICATQQEWIAAVLPAYRQLAGSGAAELSTSAFYHPILPLLCDTDVAAAAHPGIRLPRQRFHAPEDAREQLRRARQLHLEVFGAEPAGLWPSEGGVSAETAAIAAEEGFGWLASDEQVLANSLRLGFERSASGAVGNAAQLYTGYRLGAGGGSIAILFRDHELSDRIGFVYSQMPPEDAAADFVRRLRTAAAPITGRDAVVAVILDGENAWEYYPRSGRPFLRALYRQLTTADDIATCTFSEAAALPAPSLPWLSPGSWINGNFDIWIGGEDDNQSWDLLAAARQALGPAPGPDAAPARVSAYEALLAAEGSDWNWWYGPEHESLNAAEFDALYRALLSEVYARQGRTPPARLQTPIPSGWLSPLPFSPATGAIHPRVDGRITSYFEWLGAAELRSREHAAAMHGGTRWLAALLAGYDSASVFLRLDFTAAVSNLSGEIQIEIAAAGRDFRLELPVARGQLQPLRAAPPLASGQAEAALRQILEIRLSLAALGLDPAAPALEVRTSLFAAGLRIESLPAEGSVALLPPGAGSGGAIQDRAGR
ncbi:MAG: glycoside hydrolase family 57 protein [Terriglobales bacterium]